MEHDDLSLIEGDPSVGILVFLSDNSVEFVCDVVDEDLIERKSCVELFFRCREGIVGVSACCAEVVGNDCVLSFGIECLSVYGLDGNALNGSGNSRNRAEKENSAEI